jgi:thermitase
MSFSTTEYSATLSKAIANAWSSGIAIVAAVGNDGSFVSGAYPASYPQVIGVAATDFQDHIASFSNYGTAVSVDATGAFVVSTAPGGRYAAAWGTSFSAPIVSGGIAMIASLRGHGHADSMSIVTTADNIDSLNPGFAGQLGKGRVNLQRALKNRNYGIGWGFR